MIHTVCQYGPYDGNPSVVEQIGTNKYWQLVVSIRDNGTQLLCHFKMADQDEAVREFVAVTDVDDERARFFLESADWDLQVYIHTEVAVQSC